MLLLVALRITVGVIAQDISVELNKGWQFSKAGTNQWKPATVPGTVHTDLLANKLIPDPFFGTYESKLKWIDSTGWEYKTRFDVPVSLSSKENLSLIFDGLDTYADVFMNGRLILCADNMFRGWEVDVKKIVTSRGNELKIRFHSALNTVDSIAKTRLPLVLPDNNRVYARKAQFQFGWDWGQTFIGCGIWKKIELRAGTGKITRAGVPVKPMAKLVQQEDSAGVSFYFEKNGKPVYIKGANYIPSDVFLPRVKKEGYRKIIQSAKDANMNMLRVWGGGIYEADEFYDLCDEMGIMVWQDFMFAGGMYPGDESFFSNVKAEVKYQIGRLKKHPCIVLWCGNNEIDEAWHHWGWQNQFNLHGKDSATIWNDYTRLFRDSLRAWVNEFDGQRPYVSTSPQFGWGNPKSYREGDSHYWGLWWGLEDWEIFESKTGRFVSEYGMQAMPNYATLQTVIQPADLYLYSPAINAHQKANDGFNKLNHYLNRYFIDTVKLKKLSVEEYTYLTQCLQYYILKNSIAIHRSKAPYNMGTLLWQLNDCWPVSSWSITDYSRAPKAAWYAVKEAYRDDVLPVKETVKPKDLKLSKPAFSITQTAKSIFIRSDVDAKYVYLCVEKELNLSDNYFDLKAGETKQVMISKTGTAGKLKLQVLSLYDVFAK